MILKMYLCPDPRNPKRRCIPHEILHELSESGQLSHTIKAMEEEALIGGPGGLCHDIAMGLMADLVLAKRDPGWVWVQGWPNSSRNETGHSWLECDGWDIEVSNRNMPREKDELPVLITSAIAQRGKHYKTTIRRDSKGFKKFLKGIRNRKGKK